MKKIINGKVYNTDTAERVGYYWNGLSNSDFRHCEEELYLTKKGAWFISGAGGAMTRWSRSCGGNARCGGEGIEVLTDAEALAWCESHDIDPEIIEQHFKIAEG